ncbi:UDP-N-acetylmuramate dehydrogenase [Hippea sp. KM1]|uniref:UDP-N-acetylmuramate dehydrogenase n=1 Tax=Hippea sp. KM1 TaxID=944481 RepID=UPI00046D3969|nr:UDP-N-acetylmuramate dehydrogenase [Hippea sp. KM1]
MITKLLPLEKITTIRQDGSIWVHHIETEDDCKMAEMVIGHGSNLLIKQAREVYKLSERFNYIKQQGDRLLVGGATPIRQILRYCLANGLTGMEFLTGVPASLGGVVYMNAGAFGDQMGDIVDYIRVFDLKEKASKLVNGIRFSYRNTNIDGIILEAALKLKRKDRGLIKSKMENVIKRRLKSAHIKNTFGSVFKNPQEKPAGWLIERVGLKGFKKNTAMISPKHANYILGLGRARIDDILYLIDMAKERVLKTFGIELSEEVVIL